MKDLALVVVSYNGEYVVCDTLGILVEEGDQVLFGIKPKLAVGTVVTETAILMGDNKHMREVFAKLNGNTVLPVLCNITKDIDERKVRYLIGEPE